MKQAEMIYRKFHVKYEEKYSVREREHWSRVSREAVESPSLDILKTYLEGNLVQPVPGEPALARN